MTSLIPMTDAPTSPTSDADMTVIGSNGAAVIVRESLHSLDMPSLDARSGDQILVEPLHQDPVIIRLTNPAPEPISVFIEREERPKWGRPPKTLGPRGARYGRRR